MGYKQAGINCMTLRQLVAVNGYRLRRFKAGYCTPA